MHGLAVNAVEQQKRGEVLRRARAAGAVRQSVRPGLDGRYQLGQGVFAPAGTPKPIVDRLSKELATIIALPDVQARLRGMGVEPDGRGSAAFADFQLSEVNKWAKVIKDAGIQAE